MKQCSGKRACKGVDKKCPKVNTLERRVAELEKMALNTWDYVGTLRSTVDEYRREVNEMHPRVLSLETKMDVYGEKPWWKKLF